MSSLNINPPHPIFTDTDGSPLDAGYIYVGTEGLDAATNPISVYWDAALTIPATQPIRTSAGYPLYNGVKSRFYANSKYSITVLNKRGVVVDSSLTTTDRVSSDVITSSTITTVADYTALLALTPASFPVGSVVIVYDINTGGEFVVSSGSATDNGGTIKTNATWNAASKHFKRIFSGPYNVKWFGLKGDNSTDDTSALSSMITNMSNGSTIFFPNGTYKLSSQVSISAKEGLTFVGDKYSKLLFTDGAYIGLLFTSASYNCTLKQLQLYGTNNSTPAITLVKSTGDSAYFRIEDCQFAFASICVLLAKTYIVKLKGNDYSNSDIFVKGIISEGSNADLSCVGETYGTTTIGSSAAIDLIYMQARFTGCYWELQGHSKKSLYARTGCQTINLSGCSLENSGEIHVESSVVYTFSGNGLKDAYSNSRSLKLDGGSSGAISGGFITFGSLGNTAVDSSSTMSCNGILIDKATIGINHAGSAGTITGNVIGSCTTGVKLIAGSAASVLGMNSFIGNTTDIDNAGGGPNLVAVNYATVISDAANNGTMFGNSPKRGYLKSTLKGVTGSRPTLSASDYDVQYLDTTLDADGKVIFWNGSAWVDATGAVV